MEAEERADWATAALHYEALGREASDDGALLRIKVEQQDVRVPFRNGGRDLVEVQVANTGDRPIQVGSHFHFLETNPALGRSQGRDHHPQAFTIWMAGGGVRAGYTHGATDEFGFHIVEKPVHVYDLQATILHLLGLDHPDQYPELHLTSASPLPPSSLPASKGRA